MKNTLIVTDHGDPSVGCYPQSWEVQCPPMEELDREWFRQSIINLYYPSCDGKCTATYAGELTIED